MSCVSHWTTEQLLESKDERQDQITKLQTDIMLAENTLTELRRKLSWAKEVLGMLDKELEGRNHDSGQRNQN